MANLVSMADKEKKAKTAGARVDEETYSLLESIAEERYRTVSSLVGQAIEEWLIKEGYRKAEKPAGQKKRA